MRCGWGPYFRRTFEVQAGNSPLQGQSKPPAKLVVLITVNPPYMIGEHGLKNDNEAKYIARHEVYCTLQDVVEQSAKLLKDKGRFYMVHRPFRLPEIMCEMCRAKLEPKRMRLVYSRVDKEPSMVLIEGMKNGRPRMQVEAPLIVYEQDGSYTEEVLAMYGDMKKSREER